MHVRDDFLIQPKMSQFIFYKCDKRAIFQRKIISSEKSFFLKLFDLEKN